jgi:hypothetical protein
MRPDSGGQRQQRRWPVRDGAESSQGTEPAELVIEIGKRYSIESAQPALLAQRFPAGVGLYVTVSQIQVSCFTTAGLAEQVIVGRCCR